MHAAKHMVRVLHEHATWRGRRCIHGGSSELRLMLWMQLWTVPVAAEREKSKQHPGELADASLPEHPFDGDGAQRRGARLSSRVGFLECLQEDRAAFFFSPAAVTRTGFHNWTVYLRGKQVERNWTGGFWDEAGIPECSSFPGSCAVICDHGN